MKGWQFWLGSCLLLLFSAGSAGAQGLTVISPNGGESWLGASQQTISWSYVNVDNIKIEYSLNNGLSWKLLVSNYPTSALSYNWQVPALGSTQAKVRITSSLQFIQDESNAVFSIPEPSINLTYPNGGESCATGSMQYAEWNSSGIASVVLQYSQNDGQSWQDIGTFPAGNQYANWVAPASAGAVKLRAYNVENINKNDVSDGPVQVLAASPANPAKYSGSPYDGYDMSSSLPDALQLVSPNGGEVLNPYTDAPIQWTFTDVNRVNLFYSTNNGSSWTAIASDVPADALQYSWSVPNTPSTNCRVKVVAADVALEDISNSKFTISDAFVQITYPNAGETFTAGTMQYIEWDYNAVATVKLEYSTDNGSSWNLIGTAPAGNKYANWVVPASASSGMLLRIADNAVPSLYDISDLSLPWQTASPANPAKYSGSPYDGYSMDDNIPDSIRISSPNGGEIWMSSSTKTITWTYNHVDNISLEYTLNDGQSWQSIVSNIPASQLSYNWVVPTTPSNLCRIRVKDILRPAITDLSDNPFIIPTGAVQITYPNGGENYGTGTMQYIEWTSTGLETVKLEYSTDNGSSWNVIGTAPAANQYANWTAPLTASENCLVRVSDVGNQAVYSDQSNAVFRLFSSSPANPAKYSGSPFDGYSMYHFLDEYVKVIKPNGGEIWGNGTTHQIRWATLNNNENLKIEYSTDNEASWTTLLNNVPNTPVTYNWSIAAQPSTICKVRASTMSGSEIDKSDDFFTIANTTGIITSAITGSEFCPGQTFPVSFFKTVNFNPGNRFIVQLSDSVGTFNGALENIGEVQSTSVVPIPVTIPQRFYTSNLYRLRVIATDPPTIGTDNGSNFSIRPLPLAKLGEDITLCTGSSRQLDVTNQGATYLWSTGATTPSITVSQAGTYSVAVTNSCGTSRDTVKVKLLSPPSLELGPDKQICQNSVVVLEADSGASSYLWSTGATTRRINAVLAGKYVVYATNACGTSRDSVNVSYLQAQSLELGADRGLCPGSSITLNATTSNSTYLWSTGSTAPSITITQPGTYAVNVTTQCGLLSDQVTVFDGKINLSAGADVQLCRGGTATLQATGANSYTWNTGQTGSIIEVSPQNTTTYTVTATNIYNCTATDQVQVQVLPAPTTPQVTAQGSTTFCNGDSVTLQTPVQNGFTYQWLRNGLSVSGAESASYKARSTANYQVRVSNAGKCEATSQGIQITVNLPDTLQRDTTACGYFSWQGATYTIDTVLVSAPQNCLVKVWNVGIQPFVTQLRDTSACGRLVLNGIIYTSNAQEITDTIGCTRRGWNISIQPFIRDTTSASACGSYTWKGRTLSSTGFYADTLACAVSVLKLKIQLPNSSYVNATLDSGDIYNFNGTLLTQPGEYRDTLGNISGCDSIVVLNLFFRNFFCKILASDSIICKGDSITLEAFGYGGRDLFSFKGPFNFQGHSYYFFPANSWQDANSYTEFGGHLVSISNLDENDFLKQKIDSLGYIKAIIGLNDSTDEGNFRWTTDEPILFNNWAPGQPLNSDSSDYVLMSENGFWELADDFVLFDYSHPYILEFDSILNFNRYIYRWSTGEKTKKIKVSPENSQNYVCSVSKPYTLPCSGCAVFDTVSIIVKNLSYDTIYVSINEDQTYTWNGQTYSNSGTYSWTGSNAAGCDSTATLVLTILPESNPGPLQYQAIQEKLGACVNSPVKLSIKTLPRISTDSVKMNVNGDAATAYGNILNDGGKTITRRGFCWSTSANPTLSNSFSENGSGLGLFIGTLSGLNANTNYYIRAYAGTATEVWYGNELMTSFGNGLQTIDGPKYLRSKKD